MQVGDMVCYNAAGQKYKTLGVVFEIEENYPSTHATQPLVLIQWCVVGDIMPRRSWGPLGWSRDKIQPGEYVWHEVGNWFEVTND
jgi:hypothetical protein